MGLYESICGSVDIEIICASPADTLTAVNEAGIIMSNIAIASEISIQATINRLNLQYLTAIIQSRSEKIRILKYSGIFWVLQRIKKRPVLLFGIVLFLLLSFYLPTRVLFVSVDGNNTISERLIVEKAADCGIGFGASRRKVRSEKMKNSLLSAIPELRWAGINTRGCVAVISVLERTGQDDLKKPMGLNSIVAAVDGVICEITSVKGNPLCKVGQAVKKGQLLVSGYTDCGRFIKVCDAEGEIKAQTNHKINAVTPTECTERGAVVENKVRYRLKIGKNIINFFKDSGILDSTCVKMYEQKYFVLPGDFRLPVALVIERTIRYDDSPATILEPLNHTWINEQTEKYLTAQMTAGYILSKKESLFIENGICSLKGIYSCIEMIGQKRNEEIVEGYGKRD